MTEPITKFDDVVEIYFESGNARIRFKEGVTPESLFHEKTYGNTNTHCRTAGEIMKI